MLLHTLQASPGNSFIPAREAGFRVIRWLPAQGLRRKLPGFEGNRRRCDESLPESCKSKGLISIGNERNILGKAGEDLAVCTVSKAGLKVLSRNYRCPKGEMDIIAQERETLVFIEVRTRRSGSRGWGEESITQQKARRLRAIASYYLLQQGYETWPDLRFDLIAIRWSESEPELKWLKGAL